MFRDGEIESERQRSASKSVGVAAQDWCCADLAALEGVEQLSQLSFKRGCESSIEFGRWL